MSLSRESRNERKLKAARRAQFRLQQRFDQIDWEFDVLLPELDAWKGRAQLPEPPSDMDISIEADGVAIVPPKPPCV